MYVYTRIFIHSHPCTKLAGPPAAALVSACPRCPDLPLSSLQDLSQALAALRTVALFGIAAPHRAWIRIY